jgi:four helix bundle protein
LTQQIRRAAVSIPSNVAEGQFRNSSKEFKQFLSIALGSAAELETQLIIAGEIDYLSGEESTFLLIILERISSVRLGNCMRWFCPPHPNPLPPKRVERE